MFTVNLSGVSEVQYVAVVLQFAQNHVRAIHGYAIIGIEGVAEDDVDQLSCLELGSPLASCQLGEARS